MRSILLITLSLLVFGCAAMRPAGVESTPTCAEEAECRAKWDAAERWITDKAHRTVVEKTDDVLRTGMTPGRGNDLSVTVERVRTASGEYRIVARIRCSRLSGCDPSRAEAMEDFNRYVNGSWIELRKRTE